MALKNCKRFWLLALPTLALLQACSSNPFLVSHMPIAKYQVLGPATGQACGMLGFLATATNFIPMGINSRVERAYANAVETIPGATGLINVELQDDWAWAVFGSVRCAIVKGDAIKEL